MRIFPRFYDVKYFFHFHFHSSVFVGTCPGFAQIFIKKIEIELNQNLVEHNFQIVFIHS